MFKKGSRVLSCMTDRYDRQIQMIGPEGQRKLQEAKVVIVGCGGLGSVAAEILARAGVGRLVLVDHDMVELTNLQRQAVYCEEDVGKLKAEVLAEKLSKVNSSIVIEAKAVHLDAESAKDSKVLEGDVVLDCTDNMETRRVIANCKVWVHGAAAKDKGTVKVFTGERFEDVYPGNAGDNCAEGGIMGAAAHIVAAMQANEAIKLITGRNAEKDLLRIDTSKNTLDRYETKSNISR